MKNNLDIAIGLLAWIIALANLISDKLSLALGFAIDGWTTIPFAWWACLALMFFVTKRRSRFFWWVWLSMPLALMWWILGLVFGFLLIVGG